MFCAIDRLAMRDANHTLPSEGSQETFIFGGVLEGPPDASNKAERGGNGQGRGDGGKRGNGRR
jgi:hypothetical protein